MRRALDFYSSCFLCALALVYSVSMAYLLKRRGTGPCPSSFSLGASEQSERERERGGDNRSGSFCLFKNVSRDDLIDIFLLTLFP
ncbi:MAG: hypothetical protein JOS17DRAFT_752885 [Linnemannia elongata]|nr:MAG: hypothetical protein JOS17DRAFT_752885 [Linnemannia elongata]